MPKVNQAYVWALTKVGSQLWFGTAPNVHCLVVGSYLGFTLPHRNQSWVCEFGQSQYAQLFGLPPMVGDWRPPQIFAYDTAGGTLTDKSPQGDVRFRQTLGIRGAGAHNNVILLGGVALTGGINLFAFRADTGEYLGSFNHPAYNNIRKSLVVDDILYFGVGNTAGGGSVLRWRGDVANPFQFEVVGTLDGDAAELALHEGRIFVSTWPQPGVSLAGLYMSTPIPASGLTAAHIADWIKVWQADDYEPDPVTAHTYGGGALASYQGYLYWGTMHVPLLATVVHTQVYGIPAQIQDILAAVLGTHRAISIFRGRNFATSPEVDLLYGNRILPVYRPGEGWQFVPNKMGTIPRFGLAGFFNFFNNYTWSMAAYDHRLFIGTMDWSYLLIAIVMEYLSSLGIKDADRTVEQMSLPVNFPGADLFRFPNAQVEAVPVSVAGMGNFTNYGVRNILADDALYLGMANPMNLLTNPNDFLPEGGWELIKLTPMPWQPAIFGYVFLDENGDGWRQNAEQAGVRGIILQLMQGGQPTEQSKSVGSDGWYQFDVVLPGNYSLKAMIPDEYVPTSPTEVSFWKGPGAHKLFNFGVERARAAIGGHVWYDDDGNGLQDANEFGLENVTVDLLADVGGEAGAVVATATTGLDGAFLFDPILPGTYWVRATDQQGVLANMTLTTGQQGQPALLGPIAVAHKEPFLDANFGYLLVPGPGQAVIGDLVWLDDNGNGLRDVGEAGLRDVQVCATPMGYTRRLCGTTDGHGRYWILVPAARTYLVAPVNLPENLTATTSAFYAPVVVRSGDRSLGIDFGYR